MAHPIEFSNVWKRYQIGAQHDSLRDAIPNLIKGWIKRHDGHELAEGEFWALRDVSFHVNKGETLGIIGPNGAGKSTILKLLSRIIRQTRGTVAVHGRFAALIELGGGFHPDLTGRENIYLQGTMLGLHHREVKRLFDTIVAFSELGKFLETPVKRYSSGMVVRLGFAIAAQVYPEVLLLDEVLAVGDLAFQQKCFQRIAELKERGTTMIFISHNLEAVQKLCDRALLLQQGQRLAEGAPSEMIRRYREEVLAAMLAHEADVCSANEAVTIQDVMLRDGEGCPVTACETGQPLRVEIGFQAHRSIRQPSFRVSIERMDGLLCHATASRHADLNADVLTGAGMIALDYPAMNLLPNLYQVIVQLFEGDTVVPVATARQRQFFQITADHHEQGTVHLDHTWTLDQHAVPAQ